ncbi:hypothetical protein [Streptococcus sp. S784/96/1]|uniref:hypothetical protein n=1 Tax=Streptococcus sp. S784/96/1 TaxID=2653499 RepID=UPI001386CD84|nr:hypothetical protein [Streptococcus sp. S784/96/1]
MSKIDDLNKRLEAKKEALIKEIEARDKKNDNIKKLEQDIKILEAEVVTAHLVANNMTLDDLAQLLSTTEEVTDVSSN